MSRKAPLNRKAATAKWERMLKVLCFFLKSNGHCNVPASTKPGSLGHWLAEQLTGHRAGRLSVAQFRRLDALGVFAGPVSAARWRQNRVNDRRWDEHYATLLAFKKRHGHCSVPLRHKQLRRLANWVSNLRLQRKKGLMSQERINRLDAAGFRWEEGGQYAVVRWEKQYAKLVAFKKRHGHCDVPCHWPGDRPLGHWVSNQRRARNQGTLSQERMDRLERMGFRWMARFDREAPPQSYKKWVSAKDARWDSRFAALLKYKKKHGHCNVRPDDGRGGRLHTWVLVRRREARKNLLRADRRQRLDEAGFLWQGHNPSWDNWDRHFAKLVAYKKRFGHCDVPCHWKKDPRFGHWISNQRSFRNKGLLRQDRINRLDQIGFRWLAHFPLDAPPRSFRQPVKALDQLWEFRFAELARFQMKQGHCRIPSRDSRWDSLFHWAGRQRKHWRAGRLPEVRHRRLGELGFPWKPHNPSWELKFAQLRAYKKRFGHCEVPARWPENKPLAKWVRHQRDFRNAGTLSRERIRRLNSVGFAWGNGRRPKRMQ